MAADWAHGVELPIESSVVQAGTTDQRRVTKDENHDGTGPTEDGSKEQQSRISADENEGALEKVLDVLPQARKLFLSSLNTGELRRCGLDEIFRHVKSKEDYWKELELFVSARESLWIVLMLPTFGNQPVIGRSLVSESDLYAPLSKRSSFENLTDGNRVLLFTSQGKRKPKNVAKSVQYRASSNFSQNPKRAALCGTEFYRWDIPWDSDLLKAHEGLSRVFSAMDASGKVVTPVEIIQQIKRYNSELQLVQISGVPSAAMSLWRGEEPSSGATFGATGEPVETFDILLQRKNLQNEKCLPEDSEASNAINIALAVIISKYDKSEQRYGSNWDEEYIRDSANHLGCREEDIRVLCPTKGRASKADIRCFFETVIQLYKCKERIISIQKVFLFVSGHGNQDGFQTSNEEIMQVRELVEPVMTLGAFVLLFYQACRGDNRHSTVLIEWNHTSGLVFQSDDTSGCCLPPDLPNCAAIFACMPGYKSLRDINGGLMFQALPRAVSTPFTSVAHLAEKIQTEIHVIRPDGKSKPNKEVKEQQFVQIQFTDNGHLNKN